MLAHLYMGLSELVMRGSEEKKNDKWLDPPKTPWPAVALYHLGFRVF